MWTSVVLQLFDRIKLFGMPPKHQPDLIYLRYVPLWKVHIFTVVQLSCLIVLWVIKASAAAVIFPMMVRPTEAAGFITSSPPPLTSCSLLLLCRFWLLSSSGSFWTSASPRGS